MKGQKYVRVGLVFCLILITVSIAPVNRAVQAAAPSPADTDTAGNVYLYIPGILLNSSSVPGAGTKICLVTDTSGVNDNGFNSQAWQGILNAQNRLGITGVYRESHQESDYAANINAFLQEDCDLIVTVGFLLIDATKNAAQSHPGQKFAIVDVVYDPAITNIMALTFSTDQSSFLIGYLAAGMTQKAKVSTWGGMPIPPVTQFMDGYYYGVQYYNAQKSTAVQVLGWNATTQTGTFINSFTDQILGKTTTQSQLSSGSDVVFPVAGPAGIGGAEAVKIAGDAWIIGVDTDWVVTNPTYADYILASSVKRIDNAVQIAIDDVVYHRFLGGTFIGNLENGGVGIGTIPDSVPNELKQELDLVKAGIIDGTISVYP